MKTSLAYWKAALAALVIPLVIEVTIPALNGQILAEEPVTASITFSLDEVAIDLAGLRGASGLAELNHYYNADFLVDFGLSGDSSFKVGDCCDTARWLNVGGTSVDGLAQFWVNQLAGNLEFVSVGAPTYNSNDAGSYYTIKAFMEPITTGTAEELESLTLVGQQTLLGQFVDFDLPLDSPARSFAFSHSDAQGNFVAGPNVAVNNLSFETRFVEESDLVEHIPASTINLAEFDLPAEVKATVRIPAAADGTVTILSTQPDIANHGTVAFTADGSTIGSAVIQVTGTGSTKLELSNNLNKDNGPARSIVVHPLKELKLKVPASVVACASVHASVTGSYGEAGDRDLTNHPDTTFESSDQGIVEVNEDGSIVLISQGVVTITARNGDLEDSQEMRVTGMINVQFNLNWDGDDEPFYTEGDQGIHMPIDEVNTILQTSCIPLEAGSFADNLHLRDCCGGNHFLLVQSTTEGVPFYANLTQDVGIETLDLQIGYFQDGQTTGTVWAYAEHVTDPSNAGMAELTVVGTQTLTIEGGGDAFFNFSLEGLGGARSFAIQIESNRGPAINLINFLTTEPIAPQHIVINEFVASDAENLAIAFNTPNPNREHVVHFKPDLNALEWKVVDEVVFGDPDGNVIIAQFKKPAMGDGFYRVAMIPPEAIFFDDFESGVGDWTHGGDEDNWALGKPTTGPDQAHSSENVWATGLDENYPDFAFAWLRSPVIDLSGVDVASLVFWEWRDIEGETATGFTTDLAHVLVKDANDLDGEPLEYLLENVSGSTIDWKQVQLSLGEMSLGKEIVIEFLLETDDSNSKPGWYIDDVSLVLE